MSEGVLLLDGNEGPLPHTAVHTVQTFEKLHFEVMEHPPYRLDVSPSDYRLFGQVEDALNSHRFSRDQEVKEAVYSSA